MSGEATTGGGLTAATGVAGRYALALVALAEEVGALDHVEKDVVTLRDTLKGSADLQRLVRSPLFSIEDQLKGLEAVFGGAGLHQVTVNFLGVLTQNRRLSALGRIADSFFAILASKRGELAAEVTSAVALSEGQMEAIKGAIKQAYGRDIQLSAKVDPALIGGLVVRVGSRMIDNSIKTKLNNLKIAMKEVG